MGGDNSFTLHLGEDLKQIAPPGSIGEPACCYPWVFAVKKEKTFFLKWANQVSEQKKRRIAMYVGEKAPQMAYISRELR